MKEELNPSLAENWEISGSDFDDFKDAISALADCTTVTQYDRAEINLMSLKAEDNERFFFTAHENVRDTTVNGQRQIKVIQTPLNIVKRTLTEKNIPQKIIDELHANKRMLYLGDLEIRKIKHGITAFISPNFISTFASRRDAGCKQILKPSLARDAFLAECNIDPESPHYLNLVSRKIGECTKVFGAFSEQYPYIPQTTLIDIVDGFSGRSDLGNVVCKNWKINHSISVLYVEFPDYAADISKVYNLPDVFTPGCILVTSDIGDCSVSCIGTWNLKGSRIVHGIYKRKHRGNVTIKDILRDIDKEVFSVYRKLPERLADLLMLDVNNPEAAIDFAIDHSGISKSGHKNFIGKKSALELINCLKAEINPTLTYTAYDIVSNIMSVPDRVQGLTEANVEKLRNTILDVALLNWESFVKKPVNHVVLTA